MPTEQPTDQLEVILAGNTEFVLWETLIELERNTLELLREVDKAVSHDDRGTLDWEVVRTGLNSPLTVTVRARPRHSVDDRHKVIDASVSGINTLSTRRARPRYFSERALETAKRIATLYDHGALKIEYRTNTRSVVPKPAIVKNVDAILAPPQAIAIEFRTRSARAEFGSLQGVVVLLRSGQLDYFVLKEASRSVEIKCTFADILDSQVRSAWKKRVRLLGQIQYDKDGIPHTMNVNAIKELKAASDLPQFKDFAINITGGMESAEYVRELRDAE